MRLLGNCLMRALSRSVKGKGDHVIYRNPVTGAVLSLDGGPNHKVLRGVWAKLKKRYGLSD
jgi:hypothetical protein